MLCRFSMLQFFLYYVFSLYFPGDNFVIQKKVKQKCTVVSIYAGLHLQKFFCFYFHTFRSKFFCKKISNNSSLFERTFSIYQITNSEGHNWQIAGHHAPNGQISRYDPPNWQFASYDPLNWQFSSYDGSRNWQFSSYDLAICLIANVVLNIKLLLLVFVRRKIWF